MTQPVSLSALLAALRALPPADRQQAREAICWGLHARWQEQDAIGDELAWERDHSNPFAATDGGLSADEIRNQTREEYR